MLVDLKRKFRTIDSPEAALGITVESYIDGSPSQPTATDHIDQDLNLSASLAGKLSCLSKSQLKDLIIESLRLLGCDVDVIVQLIKILLVEQPDLGCLENSDPRPGKLRPRKNSDPRVSRKLGPEKLRPSDVSKTQTRKTQTLWVSRKLRPEK